MKKQKRTLVTLFTAAALLLAVNAAWLPAFAEQAGSDAIHVASASDLCALAQNCQLDSWSQGKTISLDADIDLSSSAFSGIPTFGGTFEGNGHTLSNFSVLGDGSVRGVFRYVQQGGTVKNLNVTGMATPSGSKNTIGGVVGSNSGLVQSCTFNGAVSGASRIGGIAGENTVTGVIQSSSVSGVVYGEHFVGGIVGDNQGVVENCENDSCVNTTIEENDVDISSITLNDLTETESVATITDIGGIAGQNAGVLRNCRNCAQVGYNHIGYNIGGIAGSQTGYIEGCINTSEVSGRKEVGGIVGQMEPNSLLIFNQDTLDELDSELATLQGLVDKACTDASGASSSVSNQLSALQSQVTSARSSLTALSDQVRDGVNVTTEPYTTDLSVAIPTLKPLPTLDPAATLAPLPTLKPLPTLDPEATLPPTSTLKPSPESGSSGQPTPVPTQEPAAGSTSAGEAGGGSTASEITNSTVSSAAASQPSGASQAGAAASAEGTAAYGQKLVVRTLAQNRQTAEFMPVAASGAEASAPQADAENLQQDASSKLQQAANDAESKINAAADTVNSAAQNAADSAQSALNSAAQNAASDAVSKAQSALDEAQSNVSNVLNGTSVTVDVPSVEVTNEDQLTATKDSLSSSLDGIFSTMDGLNQTSDSEVQSLISDIRAINVQIGKIGDTLTGLNDNLNDDPLQDVSNEDTKQDTSGKVYNCINQGTVQGDLNVGGITGAMAMENTLDPEDDVTTSGNSSLNFSFRTRVVIRDCRNTGSVTAKKQDCGGISGLEAMGSIIGSLNTGTIAAADASGVGGVAGESMAIIRESYAKCHLSGTSKVGGIAGIGSTITDCRAMAEMDDGTEYLGTIAGKVDGLDNVSGNTFVQNEWGGVDGVSYTGVAEPMNYEDFVAQDGLPDEFRTLTLTFQADDIIVAAYRCQYGEALSKAQLPEVPQKDGYNAEWGYYTYGNITFDETIEAVYTAYAATLESTEMRGDKPIMLAEGNFTSGTALTLKPSDAAPAGTSVQERWQVSIPDDGQGSHELRYLPDGDVSTVAVYVQDASGAWQKADTKVNGSYVMFTAQGNTVVFCTVKKASAVWPLALAAVGILLAVLLAVRIHHRRAKGSKVKEKADAPQS